MENLVLNFIDFILHALHDVTIFLLLLELRMIGMPQKQVVTI